VDRKGDVLRELYLGVIAEAADLAWNYAADAREEAEHIEEPYNKFRLKLYLGLTARAVKEALELFAQMEKEL